MNHFDECYVSFNSALDSDDENSCNGSPPSADFASACPVLGRSDLSSGDSTETSIARSRNLLPAQQNTSAPFVSECSADVFFTNSGGSEFKETPHFNPGGNRTDFAISDALRFLNNNLGDTQAAGDSVSSSRANLATFSSALNDEIATDHSSIQNYATPIVDTRAAASFDVPVELDTDPSADAGSGPSQLVASAVDAETFQFLKKNTTATSRNFGTRKFIASTPVKEASPAKRIHSPRAASARVPCWKRVMLDDSDDFSDVEEESPTNTGSADVAQEPGREEYDEKEQSGQCTPEIEDEDEDEKDEDGADEDDAEQENNNSSEDSDDDEDDNVPLAKRGWCRCLSPAKNVRNQKKIDEKELVFMNWMPKNSRKGDEYVAHYVLDKQWKANGKVFSKKEQRMLTWSRDPLMLRSSKCVLEEKVLAPAGTIKNLTGDPRAIFDAIFTDEICQKIVHYTNLYGRKQEAEKPLGSRRLRVWTDVDVVELRAFIGTLLFLGLQQRNRLPISKVFSTNWYELNLPTILSFSRERFIALLSNIRFSETTGPNTDKNLEANSDRLIKISEIFDPVIKNSRALVEPGNVITVDEAVVGFKGKCVFGQYLPKKPTRYGIKVWCACDAKTGYLLNAQIYSGKVGPTPEIDQGRRVVLDLIAPYFSSKRIVVTDNFFTSVGLAMDLKSKSMDLVGTLRDGRMGVPNGLYRADLVAETKSKAKSQSNRRRRVSESTSSDDSEIEDTVTRVVKQGSRKRRTGVKRPQFEPRSAFLFTSDMTAVKAQVKPNRSVCLLSTIHHAPLVSSDISAKPEIILFYNQNKFGVDLLGQVIKNFTCKQTTRRWPFRVFVWLLDVAAYNTYVICRLADKQNPKSEGFEGLFRREFLTTLSLKLMEPQIARRCRTVTARKGHPQIRKAKLVAEAAMNMQADSNKETIEKLLGKGGDETSTSKAHQKRPVRVVSTVSKNGRRRCHHEACKKIYHRKTKTRCCNCARYVCHEHRVQSYDHITGDNEVVWCSDCAPSDAVAAVACEDAKLVETLMSKQPVIPLVRIEKEEVSATQSNSSTGDGTGSSVQQSLDGQRSADQKTKPARARTASRPARWQYFACN